MCGKNCLMTHSGAPVVEIDNTYRPDPYSGSTLPQGAVTLPYVTTPLPTDLEPTVKHPKFDVERIMKSGVKVPEKDTRTPLMKVLKILDTLDDAHRDRLIEAVAVYYGRMEAVDE